MKRSIAFIAMMIVAAACTRQQEQDFNPCPTGQELTLTAYAPGIEAPSKTNRDADGKVYWSAAEEISLFYGSGENGGSKFTSTNTTSAKTAQFSGVINSITGIVEDVNDVSFWGIYPYNGENACDGTSATMVIPDVQTSEEGTFSDGCFPSIGKSTGLLMGFYNVCGGFKFQLSQEGITSVTFRGNNNEDVAGKVKVTFGSDNKPAVTEIVSGEKDIVITPAAGGAFQTGVDYFIVIRPVTFSQGVTFVFEKADGSTGTRTVNVSFPINRSQFQHSSSAIDTGVVFSVVSGIVDLGLSVKWATCNLGASQAEQYGDYYAWGEIEPYYTEGHSQDDPCSNWRDGKTGYNWASYKWCNGSATTLTKYNTKDSNGTVDNKTTLDPEDDAAYATCGGSWRMPTKLEWEELEEGCTWTWTNNYNGTGVAGMIVTSNQTGYTDKSIFLPASGWFDTKFNDGKIGYYRSSTLYDYYPSMEYTFIFDADNIYGVKVQSWRYSGYSIRPVYGRRASVPVTGVSLSETAILLAVNEQDVLSAIVSPSNASIKVVRWSSSNSSIATVDSDGRIQARYPGTAVIRATTTDGGYIASCLVKVTSIPISKVDLGLSVKWASFNLGASQPEESGDCYAWGETEPKSYYSWSTYKWCCGSYKTMIKYCIDCPLSDFHGIVDNKTSFKDYDYEDDAARKQWGGKWRIPTDAEWTELRSNCTWTTTSNYNGTGVAGMIVTSNIPGYTDKSIFLPSNGYWSSSLYIASNFPYSQLAYIYKNSLSSSLRSEGLYIRPVSE